jgi:hypothetical protein
MSTKPMKLVCVVDPQTTPGRHNVRSCMYDGTQFSLNVSINDVVLDTPLGDSPVTGELLVTHSGQQGDRASVVLPAPITTHGHNILVNASQLNPLTMPGPPMKKIRIQTAEEIEREAKEAEQAALEKEQTTE